MTLSAFAARWFGLTFSSVSLASGSTLLAPRHYEEEDALDEDDESDADSEPDFRWNDVKHEPRGNYGASPLFASSYEEEDAHRREADELLQDVDALAL
jgi:hypothetical protein